MLNQDLIQSKDEVEIIWLDYWQSVTYRSCDLDIISSFSKLSYYA